MDLFFFDRADKNTAPNPTAGNLLHFFAKLFRFLELCLALIFLSWILCRLPLAVRISAEYFAKLFAFLASPLFGFILCNAIIVALLARPCRSSSSRRRAADDTDRLYQDLVDKSPESVSEEAEIVYQDKEIVAEAVTPVDCGDVEVVKNADPEPEPERPESGLLDRPQAIRRTQSEKLKRECCWKAQRERLRRSETEKCRNLEDSGAAEIVCCNQDDLSSEEFQRKIEAFIAREKRFRREESSAIVVLRSSDG